jgi:hypothetical protein
MIRGVMECLWNLSTEGTPALEGHPVHAKRVGVESRTLHNNPPDPPPYILDAYYITVAGDLVGIIPPGDTVNTDESLGCLWQPCLTSSVSDRESLGCLWQPCLTSSVSDRESLAGTTIKVRGPFTSYNPKSKVVVATDGRQIQLLRPEKTKVLNERTKAWLKTLI